MYSSSKKKSKQETLKNARIRKSAEYIGFFENPTIIDEKTQRVEKKEKIAIFEIIRELLKFE
jgi:hypothetical protein